MKAGHTQPQEPLNAGETSRLTAPLGSGWAGGARGDFRTEGRRVASTRGLLWAPPAYSPRVSPRYRFSIVSIACRRRAGRSISARAGPPGAEGGGTSLRRRARPGARVAASARYGFSYDRARGLSGRGAAADPATTRSGGVRVSTPHAATVGAHDPSTNRLYELMFGA